MHEAATAAERVTTLQAQLAERDTAIAALKTELAAALAVIDAVKQAVPA